MSASQTTVAIVAACRTAIGTFGGSLAKLRGPQLAAVAMRGAVDRAAEASGGRFQPEMVGDVRFGSCMEDYDGLNTARIGWLLAGLPQTVPAVTINRVCTSGMEATVSAMHAIQAGFIDTAVVGGVESMSNAPYLLPDARWGARLQDKQMVDSLIRGLYAGSHFITYPKDGPVEWARGKPYIMGATAEFLVDKYGLTREEQDEVALRSHNLAERAVQNGTFNDEIVPTEVPTKRGKPPAVVTADENFRPNLTMEALASLPPAFLPKGKGSVTAGNSSSINDGSSALVIMSLAKAEELQLEPLAVIKGAASGACAPEYMGCSPVPAVNNLLKATGRSAASEYDRVEVNEAFAAQYLACERDLNLNRDVTNVNGSGIGLGHPVGSTGSRLLVSLVHELKRSNLKTGMATLCGGGGVSLAVEVERL